jgi:hypothetical protein
MLESRVSSQASQEGKVWLNNRVGHGRGGVFAELNLGLLVIVGRQTLKDESTESRTSATTERMEDEKALQASAIVGEAANFVHDDINLLLANGIMTMRVCYNAWVRL